MPYRKHSIASSMFFRYWQPYTSINSVYLLDFLQNQRTTYVLILKSHLQKYDMAILKSI